MTHKQAKIIAYTTIIILGFLAIGVISCCVGYYVGITDSSASDAVSGELNYSNHVQVQVGQGTFSKGYCDSIDCTVFVE